MPNKQLIHYGSTICSEKVYHPLSFQYGFYLTQCLHINRDTATYLFFNGSSIQGAYVGALYAGNMSEEPKYKNRSVDRTRSARIHSRRLRGATLQGDTENTRF